MSFPFYIARRYLFARKSHHAINIISIISVLGVAVATMALVCVLSIFNGFHQLVASLFTAFDPELKVVALKGKTFSLDQPLEQKIKQLDCIEAVTTSLEERALARYNGQQAMVVLKGVDDNFPKTSDISQNLFGPGRFLLHADVMEFGIPGIRLAATLGMDADYIDPLQIYTPAGGARVNLLSPDESFNMDELNSPGVVFSIGQKKYDQEYILCSLGFAQRMFEKEGQVSSLEIKVRSGISIDEAKRRVQQAVGTNFKVIDRYEQQEDVFRIMKVEKYLAYIFLTFILFIACFNIVGSLSMLIIEKKKDVVTLRNLGATDRQIQSIFLFEGRMISLSGALMGILAGLALCFVQQQYGILKLGDKTGAFIIDAYPVSVNPWDIIIIFVTVVLVSFLVSWYPVRYISKRLTASTK
ncbi:MAG: ABC transporter permease [Bacteroidaceae bacterium]|nr:ABC transporter permease [Bacteroidaceae bacterium]MBR4782649.1 ABC transporter permease [Bacteroidaceae bacterium]